MSWDNSPIEAFRQTVITNITAATDYRVRDTFDGCGAGDVIVTGGGWSAPGTGTVPEYKTVITCLYAQPSGKHEKGAEEMARRVWCSIAYSSANPPMFDPVPEPQIITIGEGDQAVSFAGVRFTIRHNLALLEDEA